MKYVNNKLLIEKVLAENIAKKYDSPTYCYSFSELRQNVEKLKKSFKSFSPLMCFSIKSNPNLTLIKEIKKFGFGADVVSSGELIVALKAGISPKKIVFSGVGKTSKEIRYAIDQNILLLNAESKSEIKEIDRIAKLKNKRVQIGIRLNPNTDAKTLRKISTGKKEDKFGVDEKTFFQLLEYCKKSKYLKLKCLSVHIGSQILDYKPYEKMLGVIKQVLYKSNHKFDYVDLGGGMGISYTQKDKKFNYKRYNSIIKKFLKEYKTKIIFEPGRSVVGSAGTLISKVIYIKKNKKKNFIILDAAMNDFMRPALYGAEHQILPSIRREEKSNKILEFVGPVCESSDKFISIKKFQKLNEKDIIVICDVGAYGMSLSSNYNLRPKPLEILLKGKKIKIIRKRQNHKDFI